MVVESKGISRISLSLEVVKVNPDGSEGESRESEVNSWLKQWPDIFATMLEGNVLGSGGSTAGVVDTGGTGRTVEQADTQIESEGPRANAAAADNTFGIQVGTGVTAVDRDDNALVTLIAEGAAATQLNYLITTFSSAVAVAGGYRVSISRQVNNNSGGSITVEEIGLAVLHRIAGPATALFLILRDLVTEVIPDTESRIFRYHMDFIA